MDTIVYRKTMKGKSQINYPIVRSVTEVVCIPEIFDKNKHEHAINTALPFALTVTLKGMVNLVILLSSPNFISQLVNISGIATALQEIAKILVFFHVKFLLICFLKTWTTFN